ncbi:uncharacterized protein LOC112961468 [Apteryx rowi]|uniref:uncharacterized protein LOC112961468 n=1 Tax=Apteryx rowi TaxID=308060 RepID=UPI000E1DAEDB|nr:uncharacterized protein LOC112961468 [Apteryx rowi]
MFPRNARWRRFPPFPREPSPPLPPRAGGPRHAWCPPPWERECRSAGGGWQPPRPWEPEPFPGPADFPSDEEDGSWAPPAPWDYGTEPRGAEDAFGDGWYPALPPPMSHPGSFACPEFPGEQLPPAWPPDASPGRRGGFWHGARPWRPRGPGWKRCHLPRGRHREKFASCYRPPRPPVSREKLPSSKAPASGSGESRSGGTEKPREGQQAHPPSRETPEPPGQAGSPRKSQAADACAVPEAAEQERAAGAEPDGQTSLPPPATCLAAGQGAAGGHGRDPTALETEPALPESAGSSREEECELAVASGGRSTLPAPSPCGRDLRSAAVLARKEEIELSYQRSSLAFAAVATMLLQQEPSMEAAMGPALRANLCQARSHHLRQLENFIDSYDAAAAGR